MIDLLNGPVEFIGALKETSIEQPTDQERLSRVPPSKVPATQPSSAPATTSAPASQPSAVVPRDPIVQQVLQNLPASLASINVFGAQNPTHTLFVIREGHYSNQFPGSREDVQAIQSQIKEILGVMQQRAGVHTVFRDGMDQSIAETYNGAAAFLRELKDLKPLIDKLENDLGVHSPEETQALRESLRSGGKLDAALDKRLQLLEKYQSARKLFQDKEGLDATLALALEGRLTLTSGENSNLLHQTLDLAHSNPNITIEDPAFAALMERREDALVAQLPAGQTSVAVFGGGHDFSNNVAAWNRAHPDQTIQVIEITPTEYTRRIKE